MALDWNLLDTEAPGVTSECWDFARFSGRIYASCLKATPYTTDNGATWTQTNTQAGGDNIELRHIITHNNRLFVGGQDAPISAAYWYTDDGTNWTKKIIGDSTYQWLYHFFERDGTLYVGSHGNVTKGNPTKYYFTTDNGDNWTSRDIYLRDCMAMAYDSTYARYYAVGKSTTATQKCRAYYCADPTAASPGWTLAETGLNATSFQRLRDAISFEGTVYTCSSLGEVYKLTGIATWTLVFSGLSDCRGLEVFYNKLYVCGDSATLGEDSVYSTTDGTTWTAEGITSNHTDVYGLWGNSSDYYLWAGTIDSKCWITTKSVDDVGSYSLQSIDGLLSAKEINGLYTLQEIDELYTLDMTEISKEPEGARTLSLIGTAVDLSGGNPYCVQVVGNHAYIGTAGAFVVVSVSNLSNPVELYTFSEDNTTDDIKHLRIIGDYAYIESNDYFSALDISDLDNISRVGQISGAENYLDNIKGFRISGNYAYITANTSDALTIIDISDPANLTKVSHISGSEEYLDGPTDVEIVGNYAYVSVANQYCVTAIDISDPENPTRTGYEQEIWSLRSTTAIARRGDYLYITNTADGSGWGGITVIDISAPGHPSWHSKLTGKVNKFWLPSDIYINGDYAYVANKYNDVCLYELVSITPTYYGRYENPLDTQEIEALFVYGSYIYAVYLYLNDRLNIIGQTITDVTVSATEMNELQKAKEITDLYSATALQEH